MRVVVLASRKGGVGKTTLCGHLAVAAESAGVSPVALLDTDPQAGLAAWWNVREARIPAFPPMLADGLQATLDDLRRRGCALVLVDTPPALSDQIRATIELADLVVVPVQPSPHDLRAVSGTVALARQARRPMVFVLNRANSRTRLTADAAVALSQHGAVATTFVHDRQDYRASMIDGRTAQEMDPQSKSAAEIAQLWAYLADRLELEDAHGADTAA
jgi:chromosome partitioning protein